MKTISSEKLHQDLSFAKSAIRICGLVILASGSLYWGGIVMIIGEVIGVLEEMV